MFYSYYKVPEIAQKSATVSSILCVGYKLKPRNSPWGKQNSLPDIMGLGAVSLGTKKARVGVFQLG